MNILRFSRRPLEMLRAWHERYGDVFTVRFLGFGTGVYVADPQNLGTASEMILTGALQGSGNITVLAGTQTAVTVDAGVGFRLRGTAALSCF